MKKLTWILGLLIIVGYLFATCLVVVEENQSVVIMQFGKPVATIREAGLAIKLPSPIQTSVVMDKRIQLLNLEPAEFVTRDHRNLVVRGFSLWRIVEPEIYLESLRNLETARSRISDLVTSNIGAEIGQAALTEIFDSENNTRGLAGAFANITQKSSQQASREYGIEIIAVRPDRFGFPRQNVQSIYQRMIAEQTRIAARYRAEGTEAAEKIKAETDREVREILARAYRESQIIKGEGEAEAASIFAEAYQTDSEYYQFSRSNDLLENLIGDNTTLILSADSPLFRQLLQPTGK